MSQKIWLSKPHMSQFEEKYLRKAFLSNWITTKGDNIDGFEDDINEFLGGEKKVVALNSGTSAIHLALMLLGVNENDEVICPSFTFCATANPILYQKAIPIFVDSELDTWNIDPFFMEEAIKDRIKKGTKPKAIIVVDSYGMPAKWDEIIGISIKYQIPIIEDSAEALGSKYKGGKCGTLGHLGVFSFNGNKIITTSSGGALICKNNSQKLKAISYSTQSNKGKTFYKHSQIGFNYRMSNVLAGVGRGQMKVIEDRINQRRKINFFYRKIFKNIKNVSIQLEPTKDFFSNFWLSCILIKPGKNELTIKEIISMFIKDDIEVRRLWKPLHTQELFKNALFYGEDRCEYLFKNGLCLPSSSNLNEEELIRIEKSVNNYFKKYND